MTKILINGFTRIDLIADLIRLGMDGIVVTALADKVHERTFDANESAGLIERLPPFSTAVLETDLVSNVRIHMLMQKIGTSTVMLNPTQQHASEIRAVASRAGNKVIVRVDSAAYADMVIHWPGQGPSAFAYRITTSMEAAAREISAIQEVTDGAPIIIDGAVRADNLERLITTCRPYAVILPAHEVMTPDRQLDDQRIRVLVETARRNAPTYR